MADIGVIGGSGFYRFLADVREVEVETPFGPPSDPVVVGVVGDREVAFLPRHGADHRFPPHRIPYRANLWALRALGVRQVLAPCAVGGLQPHLGPGSLVVPDQLVDRTSGRPQTFYDDGTVHVAFADPYCPVGRAVAVETARTHDWEPTDGGTCAVVEGPRFGTRAESQWFAAQGWSIVNMTQHPEAVLARELALCYTAIALVTDLDASVEGAGGVTMEEVFRVFGDNTERLRALLYDVVAGLPLERTCPCAGALDGMDLPLALP
ncbi:MAG: S-methyl-5'-thioadenosine phosphorylase [Mycobacteriales bacterium]|nr:S-methyl-5'-thioadenosine phosphorylase [Mycobacteriales bacterium]